MIRGGKRRDDSFFMRIWHEAESVPEWRASIMHVATREVHYFTSYAELNTFLNRWTERSAKK
jgi:hypothetical protein